MDLGLLNDNKNSLSVHFGTSTTVYFAISLLNMKSKDVTITPPRESYIMPPREHCKIPPRECCIMPTRECCIMPPREHCILPPREC